MTKGRNIAKVSVDDNGLISSSNLPAVGTLATQNANNVAITGGSITGITDLAVADGGTGASTATGARSNLLPSYSGNNSRILAVNSGGTDVEWIQPVGGLIQLASVTIPAGSPTNVDITGLATSYNSFVVVIRGVAPSVNAQFRFALSSDNGSTFSSVTSVTTGATNHSGTINIFNVSTSGTFSRSWYSVFETGGGLAGGITRTNAINALRFNFNNSATFNQQGSIIVYGQ